MEEGASTLRHRTASAPVASSSHSALPSDTSATPRPPLSRSASQRDGTQTPTPAWMDDGTADLFDGMGLLDMLLALDAHIELWTRGIRKNAVSWREKADKLVEESRIRAQKIKLPRVPSDKFLSSMLDPDREVLVLSQKDRERLEKTYKEVRQRANEAFKVVVQQWEEEKTVRLRDKISFFCGVMNVLGTALLLGFKPSWMANWYTAQIALYLPLRVYTYKKRMYHYFLFDLCYAVNFLCLVYIWILPGSTFLFEACYGLALGTLGTAIATWRNSLVFHSLDKVISLAIHIFPPLVFTTIRHFLPPGEAEKRYPALKELPYLRPWRFIAINMTVYLIWQGLYYRYVIVARKEKIKAGRATSFTYLINDKKRLIGKIAARVPEAYRESAFMLGQAIYTLVTLLIPLFALYNSKFWSSVYLLTLFGISTWSGGSFYMEVFARKFEKELIALRKEFAEQQAIISRANLTTTSPPTAPSTGAAMSRSESLDGSKFALDELAESENEAGEETPSECGKHSPTDKARVLATTITGKEGPGEVENPSVIVVGSFVL